MAFTAFVRFFLVSGSSYIFTKELRVQNDGHANDYDDNLNDRRQSVLFGSDDEQPRPWSKEVWEAIDDTMHTLGRIPNHWRRVGLKIQDTFKNLFCCGDKK